MIGHDTARRYLETQLPPATLLRGPRSVGKWTLALHLAEHHQIAPIDRWMVEYGFTIETARLVTAYAARAPYGKFKLIVARLDQSTKPALNALLKTLEEPPPRTLFVLLTTEERKIPGTVSSRCIPFHFKKLSPAHIAGRLAHIAQLEQHPVTQQLVDLLADRADGAMRDAIMALDQVARIGMTTAEQYQRLIGYTDHAAAMLDRLVAGDIPAAFARLEEALRQAGDAAGLLADAIHVLCDVIVIQCGGEVHKNGVALAARQNLALALDNTTVVAAMQIIWKLQTQVRLDDSRATLELALVMLGEVFAAFAPPKPPTRLSLAEMGGLA